MAFNGVIVRFAVLIAKMAFNGVIARFAVFIAKIADVSVRFVALIGKMTFNYFIVVFLLCYLSVLIFKVLALMTLMVVMNCLEYHFAIYVVLPEQPILM